MKICEEIKCPKKRLCEFHNNLISMKKNINYTVEIVHKKDNFACFKLQEFYGN